MLEAVESRKIYRFLLKRSRKTNKDNFSFFFWSYQFIKKLVPFFSLAIEKEGTNRLDVEILYSASALFSFSLQLLTFELFFNTQIIENKTGTEYILQIFVCFPVSMLELILTSFPSTTKLQYFYLFVGYDQSTEGSFCYKITFLLEQNLEY